MPLPTPRGRLSAVWGDLALVEPTLDEVRAAASSLAEAYNEPTNRALLTNETEMSPGDVVAMFEEMWAEGGRPFLLRRAGALLGDCDFRGMRSGARVAEVAIMVGPRAEQGKGLGTRFGAMALVVAFGHLGLERVYASIRPENAASLRMFAKVGYLVDATPEARAFAEAPDDVCVSIDEGALRRAHGGWLSDVRTAVLP